MDTYWYLATPYTRYPEGHEAAFELAATNAAMLLNAGIPTFSPIAHSHALAKTGGLVQVDHDFWINKVDRPLMRGAHGLIFLEADSWQWSSGMHEEIVEFTKAGKPIVFMKPGVVPAELTQPRDSQPAVQPDALDRFIASLDKAELYDDPRRYSV